MSARRAARHTCDRTSEILPRKPTAVSGKNASMKPLSAASHAAHSPDVASGGFSSTNGHRPTTRMCQPAPPAPPAASPGPPTVITVPPTRAAPPAAPHLSASAAGTPAPTTKASSSTTSAAAAAAPTAHRSEPPSAPAPATRHHHHPSQQSPPPAHRPRCDHRAAATAEAALTPAQDRAQASAVCKKTTAWLDARPPPRQHLDKTGS